MKTIDLAIGMQVAYRPYQHSQLRQAFVMGIRPKGKAKAENYYYGGGPYYGNDTIGIAYTYAEPVTAKTVWQCDWVQPRQIEMLWSEKLRLDAKAAERRAQDDQARRVAKAKRREQWNALPPKVRELVEQAVPYSTVESDILNGYKPSVRLTAELLTAIVAAAQDAVPEVAHAKQQAEVEAALALLGGM